MIAKTRPTVNLAERRLLSDMVGDYLRAYDETVTDIEAVRQSWSIVLSLNDLAVI